MKQNSMLAMILAGGRGSRLHELTNKVAKPAVGYGGKYRIVDFPLSNCANSGIDVVGVLTQYESVLLNSYVAAGGRWGLDAKDSGVYVLPPREKADAGLDVYRGTADAISQNIDFIDSQNPEYLLILSGDHIYKMDYSEMLRRHKESDAACTISVMEVPWEEASRFGIMSVDGEDMITEFAEKPRQPKSNLASMGIYVFSWKALRRYLTEDEADPGSENDFGKNIIPKMLADGQRMAAFRFQGYWKDVGTLTSLWDANMDMLSPESGLDLSDESWPIFARSVDAPPIYMGGDSRVSHSAINRGCDIEGTVENSVLSPRVTVEKGAKVSYSVLLPGVTVETGAVIEYAIIGEGCHIGKDCRVGGAPDSALDGKWDLTVLAPDCQLEDGREVAPGIMLDHHGKEVLK
mgnify:CR=1 FL=1